MKNRTKKKRTNLRVLLGAMLIIGVLAASAFTASNTMPNESQAGVGTVSISGYTATSINYTLGADKSTVDSVAIVVTGEVTEGSEASLQLAADGSWYDCPFTYDATAETTTLTCGTTTPVTTVEDANNLTLVIAD